MEEMCLKMIENREQRKPASTVNLRSVTEYCLQIPFEMEIIEDPIYPNSVPLEAVFSNLLCERC